MSLKVNTSTVSKFVGIKLIFLHESIGRVGTDLYLQRVHSSFVDVLTVSVTISLKMECL